MACKIYRKTRLGVRRPETAVESDLSLGPMEFRSRVDSFVHAGADYHIPGNDRGADLERQKIGDAGEEEMDVVEGKIN